MPQLMQEMAIVLATLAQADIDMSPFQFRCLARNIYHEARGEDIDGQIAVAQVTMNRVMSEKYPDTICEVVREDRGPKPWDCQFSWWCNGKPNTPTDFEAYQLAAIVAAEVIKGEPEDYVGGALHYVAESAMDRGWVRNMTVYGQIGRHVFLISEEG
ncbi:MAG: cell wall hydrolase [Rhodobacterales bacterium]|nr:cell wall hydrolase [Rhodobacterales bacterium]